MSALVTEDWARAGAATPAARITAPSNLSNFTATSKTTTLHQWPLGLCAKYEPASAGLCVSACDESRTAPFRAAYLQGISRSIQAMRVRSL
jgi:hypothetical protein